ncbi:maleylpyruvate isomerase family mycothiol-dependent enzyme [Sphaerisporangium sp. NPDC051017]|uniref:maleylpyruvate isomerase N-terminal domain-containing protein n=1 Tax=Sphaerisporangium sp. NPDC051017 TaxID=3154636 RepID=UPI0034487743
MTVLDDLATELDAATKWLLATAAAMPDRDVTAPSLLPGWTRGHVLTHVARNADSHVNLLTWAKTGVFTPQYPTLEAREAQIAEGAGRAAAEQHADLAASAARLDVAVRDTPPQAWRATVTGMTGDGHPAWYALVRRLREVELHHVDLGAGYTWADLPPAFVLRELHDTVATWPRAESPISAIHAGGRSWTGLGEGPELRGDAPIVLAWATGRLDGGPRAAGLDFTGLRLAESPPAAPKWLTKSAPPGLPPTPPEEYP